MERASGSGGGSSDFVKKLYKMLEDPTYRHIVRWSDSGDSFIVLDNTEFTKNVLPRHFKHSNFASFVRQLNKYDFHKIRNTDEPGGSQYGEQAWEFKHPNFQMHNRDQLENIRRKAPAPKRSAQRPSEDTSALQSAFTHIEELQSQLQGLKNRHKGMDELLEKNDVMCQALVTQVGDLHKKLTEYEDLIQSLILRLSQKEFEARAMELEMANLTRAAEQIPVGREYYQHGHSPRDNSEKNGEGRGVDQGEDDDDEDEGGEGDEDDEDDEDEFMDDYMDEDMDDYDDEGDYGDEIDENPPTSTPPVEKSPFPIKQSAPSDGNFNRVGDKMREQGMKGLELDEILDPKNRAISPFDPGGFGERCHRDTSESSSKDAQRYKENEAPQTMFDTLLSQSTLYAGKIWRKLPSLEPTGQSPLALQNETTANLPTPPSFAPSPYASVSPSADQDSPNSASGPIEVMNIARYRLSEGTLLPSLTTKPRFTLPARISSDNRMDKIMRDNVAANGHVEYQLPPIANMDSSVLDCSLPPVSDIKRSLDAPQNTYSSAADMSKEDEANATASASVDSGRAMIRRQQSYRFNGHSGTRPILVVDDDPSARRLFHLFFNSMSLEVDLASDGITAVKKINHQNYSIVFMDVIMPRLDGVSATRLIRETDKTTPIVCLASNTSQSDIDIYIRSGMTAILAKPFGYKKLYNFMIKLMPDLPVWKLPPELRPRKKGQLSDQQVSVAAELSHDGPSTPEPTSSSQNSHRQDNKMEEAVAKERSTEQSIGRCTESPLFNEHMAVVNGENRLDHIGTNQNVSDDCMSLAYSTCKTAHKEEPGYEAHNHIRESTASVSGIIQQHTPVEQQQAEIDSIVTSPPLIQGPFNFGTEGPSLPNPFTISPAPSGTPIENDYIALKTESEPLATGSGEVADMTGVHALSPEDDQVT